MLVYPLPLPFAVLPRDARPPEGCIEWDAAGGAQGVLNHRRIGVFFRQSRDFDVLVFHQTIVPVGEDGVVVLVEAPANRVSKHVVAHHVVKVVVS